MGDAGFRLQGLECMVLSFGFKVYLRFKVQVEPV